MPHSLFELSLKRIDGSICDFSLFKGKVLLVVNVASECGLTPQYEELEALYQSRNKLGLEVLGFPANNFNGQEHGSDEQKRSEEHKSELQSLMRISYADSF